MHRLLRLGHVWVIGAPAHYTRSVQASTLQQAQRLHRVKSCNSGIDQTITHLDTRNGDGPCRHDIYIYIYTCRLTILGLKTNAVYVGTFRLNFFAELLALARHAVRLARRARLPMRRA